jgi:hypothetical protein
VKLENLLKTIYQPASGEWQKAQACEGSVESRHRKTICRPARHLHRFKNTFFLTHAG